MPDGDLTESAFEKHRQNTNNEDERLAFEAASKEWGEVATVEAIHQENVGGATLQIQTTSSIDTSEAVEYFRGIDLSEHMSTLNTVVKRKGFCELFSCLLGPPQLHDHLTGERDLIFAITKCDWIADNAVHWRMLQTVYKQFTGDVLDCPRYGSHWQIIGFQGSDPATDFRGVGMLGLLHLLYLTTAQQYKTFAKNLYKTSVDERQNFPLAVLSLNITCVALQALRHGELNRECNQRHLMFEVFNEYYAAVLYHFWNIYSLQNKTIKDTGYLLKDVEWYCRSNVRTTLRNLQSFVNSQRNLIHANSMPQMNASFQDINLPS